jgi:hypothetical protein
VGRPWQAERRGQRGNQVDAGLLPPLCGPSVGCRRQQTAEGPAPRREWTFDVGYTTSRPVVPDEHTSRVTVLAESFADAMATAGLMVMRPGVEMPTSARYVE